MGIRTSSAISCGKLCLLAIDEMVDILGEGIANICYVINPEVVVLGGGIMAQEQFLKERVECAVKRYLVWNDRTNKES